MLFIHDTPSHPEFFIDCFSNIKVGFLPKNRTFTLEPINARIIKVFEVFYRKQLLKHLLPRIKLGSKTHHLISNVYLFVFLGMISMKLTLSYSQMMTLMLNSRITKAYLGDIYGRLLFKPRRIYSNISKYGCMSSLNDCKQAETELKKKEKQ